MSIALHTSTRRALHLVTALALVGACKRDAHLREVPLRVERIDAGAAPMAPDPAAMARAMAAADAGVRPPMPGVPAMQPPPSVVPPGAPPAVMAPVAVVDAGVAPTEPVPAASARRRRRRR